MEGSKKKKFRAILLLVAAFILMVVLGFMPYLPKIYSESQNISTVFGGGKWAIFWIIIIVGLLLLSLREKGNLSQK
jgi:TRAP-type mannitol/chloroaromatic compound transport system permease small subunit